MIYIYLPRIDESGLARGLKYCRNWCLMVQRYKNYQTLCIVSSFRWDYFLDAKFHQLFLLSYSRFLAMCSAQVDLVTMLEKAISYVKFLQLQVKVKTKNNITSFPLKTIELSWSISFIYFLMQVLATDEFWPAQGGKAPDISQVKEAIDAILSSQKDRNSSSSSKWLMLYN